MKIILATKNKGKIAEMARLLAQRRFPSRDSVETRGLEPESGAGLVSPPVELLSLNDLPSIEFPEETGETFAENAVAKARFVSERFGLPAIADDSGLEVDALGGSPGVRSARYAGQGASDEDNYKKLLIELKGVPPLARGARFRCAMALVMPGEGEIIFEGALEGGITEGPSGGNGFGYDPVFFIPDEGRTAAELTIEEKNRISHRAKALGQLKAWLGEREEV